MTQPDDYGTEPMFDLPSVYQPPRRPPAVDRWTAYKGVRHTCDLCVMNRHDGISDTDFATAKHMLTLTSGRRWLLCSVHAAQVRNRERKLPS